MVLVAFSTFFKTKLKSWSEGASAKPEILLSVPVGQPELGELLLQSMYQSQPDLKSLSQAQLLQLLVLADRYGVNKVLVAAVAALQAVLQADLQWQTVLGVYTLPPGCNDACKLLLPVMQQQLQEQLGDLELTMSDSQKTQQLRSLLHKLMLQLLADEATKVASENTVFRVIESWNKGQQELGAEPSDNDLAQVLQQIRMQHCTQPFVATVLAESPLAAKCFSPRELRLACICSKAGAPQPKSIIAAMEEADCPTLTKFPAWSKSKRPPSAMTKLVLEPKLSLAVLKRHVEMQQKGKDEQLHSLLTEGRWQGEELYVTLAVSSDPPEGGADASGAQGTSAADAVANASPFEVGMWVGFTPDPKGALRLVSCSITAVAVQQPAPVSDCRGRVVQPPRHGNVVMAVTRQSTILGWNDFFRCGAVDSWAAFEAYLQSSHLVHPGDCLHIKVEFTEVL